MGIIIKMETKTVRKLMERAFRQGQKTPDCLDYPMKIWIEQEIIGELEDG